MLLHIGVDSSLLPSINASLNALALVLLVLGRRRIRRGQVDAHRRTMLAAFAVSSLFLVLYVTHKALRGFENTVFHGPDAVRALYLVILTSHVVLAMTIPVLAITLIRLALRQRIESHRRLARVAWPVWVYVSITGVVIYAMLYHLNPIPG